MALEQQSQTMITQSSKNSAYPVNLKTPSIYYLPHPWIVHQNQFKPQSMLMLTIIP